MPGGDGTGPMGTGPIGWGLGPCGRGLAFRRGRGRLLGWRRFTPMVPVEQVTPVITEKEEVQYLEEEQKLVKQELQEIEKRLKELKK